MFQSFDVKGGPALGKRHVAKLRKAMRGAGLDGFIVPHEDEYQNEYLPAAHERLAWATGFTGSAGLAVVLHDTAALFVDGRYTVQAGDQVDPEAFSLAKLEDDGVLTWLRQAVSPGLEIGCDPRLHTPRTITKLNDTLVQAGARLKPVETNPVDMAWAETDERPPAPCAAITPHPIEHAGAAHTDKLALILNELETAGLDAALLTDPASIAWLLNWRGGDVAHTPIALATAIVRRSGSHTVFVDPAKLTPQLREHLGGAIYFAEPEALPNALTTLAGYRVSVDPERTSAWHFDQLTVAGAIIAERRDPCALPRARKNAAEIAGAAAAHRRDGAVIARFLHWLETEALAGELTEIDVATRLEEMRRETGVLKDISFETISAAGPHAALPHYRVNAKTNARLKRGTLYLVDSGGQYVDGTTDITRTVAIGRPKREMRERFTLVLKGHIALARQRFPAGTSGQAIDALARQHLWMEGFDFDHGTGHGVGSFLSVHEGPQRIAKFGSPVALAPGMIVSNEPGYYKPGPGGYGIRIENLLVVTEAGSIEGGDRPMQGFDVLTLAPIDRTLIVKSMLSKEEKAWVDAYHARVLEEIAPQVDTAVAAWLEIVCAPLSAPAPRLKEVA